MNEGQRKFREFILERVKPGCEPIADALLFECFSKQQSGCFNHAYLYGFMPRMLELIKDDQVEEIKNVMSKFSEGLTK